MNVKTALGVVGVLELLTLLCLGYYSSQLHGLQEKRSGLVAREDELRRTLLSATVFPPAVVANASQFAVPAPPSLPRQQVSQTRISSAPASEPLSQASLEENDDSLPPEDVPLVPHSSSAGEHASSEPGAHIEINSVKGPLNEQFARPPIAQHEASLPSVQPLSESQLRPEPMLLPPKSASALPQEQLESPSVLADAPFAPNPVPQAASAPALTGDRGGDGEFTVSWHDGALHWRRFARYGDAADFYGSLGDEWAHRLQRGAQEIKRHNWADEPWPAEWEPPLPAAPARPDPSAAMPPPPPPLPAKQSALQAALQGSGGGTEVRGLGSGGGIGVGGGVGVEGGGAWELDRYNGMHPAGYGGRGGPGGAGGVGLQGPSAALGSLGRGVGAGGDEGRAAQGGVGQAWGGVGGSAAVGGGVGVAERQAAVAAGAGKGAAAERPGAEKVGKAQRVNQAEYVVSREAVDGGGERGGEEVSISTHLSVDRLDRLRCYLDRWAGPVVAAVYLRKAEEKAAVERLARSLHAKGRRNFHLVLVLAAQPSLYPANLLRNLALEPVQSRLVFLLDIDLVPDAGFYSYVMANFPQLARQSSAAVFTIPAFNGVAGHASSEESFPVDKPELLQMLQAKQIKPILSGENEFWAAFSCLNYDTWLASAQPYTTQYQWPCEPYLLAATAEVPLYDERFVHYGNDKAQHVLNIFYHQFAFIVLPDHFLVHWEHALAEWADQRKRDEHMGEVLELTEQFKFESGTEAGVNWHTGVKFAPGTYRVKNGKMIVWNGEEWIDQASGQPTDPL